MAIQAWPFQVEQGTLGRLDVGIKTYLRGSWLQASYNEVDMVFEVQPGLFCFLQDFCSVDITL